MNKDLTIFEHTEFGKLTVIEKNGEPWFIAKEVSEILDYTATNKMTRRLDDDEKANVPIWDIGSNQHRNQVVIDESGFYNAVIGSKKPEAKVFKKWVTSEVLPAIRKTGGYMIDKPDDTPEEIMARALRIADETLKRREERINQLETKVEIDAPKVEFAETVMEAETDVPIGVVAKFIGIGRNKFFELLRNKGVLCKSGRMKNVANQTYIDRGYFSVAEKPIEIDDVVVLKFTTLVTPKGQDWLIKNFKNIKI